MTGLKLPQSKKLDMNEINIQISFSNTEYGFFLDNCFHKHQVQQHNPKVSYPFNDIAAKLQTEYVHGSPCLPLCKQVLCLLLLGGRGEFPQRK